MRVARTGVVALFCVGWASGQTDNSARQQLIETLDQIANKQLAARAKRVAAIQTRTAFDQRKAQVRATILELIGGLPEHRGPVAVKEFGSLTGDGFRVEKLAYESLPGFWVTANLYIPATGAGPFPAVLLAPGHEATGKQSQYSFGGNFARSGIMALAIDPLGQGERLQFFDPEKKASTIGGSTGEHGEANIPAMLIGEDIARYFVNDSMRGIDYLVSRRDVNPDRIGALGCSGGGTSTAYLAALDDRVKVAGVACYITSFKELLSSATGVQEAEQSIPNFIEQGLDFADYVEAFAPKPYAVISTMADMFPFEGARQSVEEAKGVYKLYGAEDHLQWITGPGGHGNLGPISPGILGFFIHYLKDGPGGDATFTPLRLQNAADLLCTPTGQVSSSIGGETIPSIIRANAARVLPKVRPSGAELMDDIRGLAGIEARPKTGVVFNIESAAGGGYDEHPVALQGENGELHGSIAVPATAGRKPAVLIIDSQTRDSESTEAITQTVHALVQAGRIVMTMGVTPAPPGGEGLKSPYLGTFNLLGLRALLVGESILGMRVDDAIRAMDLLSARSDVDPASITVYGNGAMGVVALHAAALDSRIRRVVIENTLTSYRMVLDEPLHRNISEILIPGVLRKYDLGDLMLAVGGRVTVINPQNAAGETITADQFHKELNYVPADRVKVIFRKAEDPLPLE